MAVTGTGVWTKKTTEPSTSVDNRDFYSGKIASFTAMAYEDAQKFVFGFSATGVMIRNPSATEMQFQWLRREGDLEDSGTVPATSEIHFQYNANKQGVLLRSDTGGAIADAEVIAYG